MRRTYVSVVVLASMALVALLVYGVVGAGGSTTLDDAVKSGERPEAPSRTLPLVDGGRSSVAALKGKPVILNFWASWCGPCKKEAPLLERAHRELQRSGGTVLGVTVSDASGDSRAFARKYGLTFPSIRDVGAHMKKAYQTTGVPETFAIDRDGRIAMISRGVVTRDFVDRALRELER